jgi:hypothetical protein
VFRSLQGSGAKQMRSSPESSGTLCRREPLPSYLHMKRKAPRSLPSSPHGQYYPLPSRGQHCLSFRLQAESVAQHPARCH